MIARVRLALVLAAVRPAAVLAAARSRVVAAFAVAVVGTSLGATPLAAAELGDWFTTPAQRAAERLEASEHEALIEEAPDAYWEGIGRYGAGDAEGAAEAFARALDERGEPDTGTLGAASDARDGDAARRTAPPTARDRDALLYNRATALTRAGRPADALELFDELLGRDPGNADARHNRDIARRLAELDEQEARDGQGDSEGESGEGESGENDGEGSEGEGSEGDGAESGDERPGDGAAGDGESDEEDEAGDAGADAGSEDGGDEEDAEARAERRAAAEAALEAERQAAAAAEGAAEGAADGGEDGEVAAAVDDDTPTEREQATEQWLRRIADDPAGLLRRRLERSHRIDYPEVKDGEQPW